MQDEQHDDRRRYPRQQMVRAILVRPNGHKLDSHLLDLSLGGARVTLPQHWSPQNGAALRLYFENGDAEESITLRGHVTRVGLDDIGVEFDPAQEADIRDLFASLGPRQ
ncbi:hypothetical protein LF41_1460 [Lysobacter dokdonensis DS-58]|uniref:PilZ domain-containing protein n=1 Tax=Lysobacter dokdonensis DS-58 TaxID=1300345 RepID=A0A0A2WD37_9GAMM|nr:PilZ domain-containing protein [Lysobacter dokdonensis]KGQ18106.1 hypothetical protein LF41_1460 [Lysobacter dokdonensis DS-58]